MHMHKHSGLPLLYGKQYMPDENKKTPPGAKCPGGAAADKKERDIRPRYCTAPSRVLAINKNGFERKLFSCPPRMLEL